MVRVCVYVSMLWNGDSFRRVLYYILNSILCYNVHTHTHTHAKQDLKRAHASVLRSLDISTAS